MPLLTRNNAKTPKGEAMGWRTAILYMAPEKIAGGNVCKHSTAGCRAACLYTAGRGAYSNVQAARVARKKLFFADSGKFLALLSDEITDQQRSATRAGFGLCVRLNGTSDIPWERLRAFPSRMSIFDMHPTVQFYDYTKDVSRALASRQGGAWPSNYALTYSRAENNARQCVEVLEAGGNVAAVFAKALPKMFGLYPVVDGDEHDLRFRDPPGAIVGLKAKGAARRDRSGFVIP